MNMNVQINELIENEPFHLNPRSQAANAMSDIVHSPVTCLDWLKENKKGDYHYIADTEPGLHADARWSKYRL